MVMRGGRVRVVAREVFGDDRGWLAALGTSQARKCVITTSVEDGVLGESAYL